MNLQTTVDEQRGVTFYTAKVNVSDTELSKLGNVQLILSMPVEVLIKTRERTTLNYLVRPLLDQMNRVFREK